MKNIILQFPDNIKYKIELTDEEMQTLLEWEFGSNENEPIPEAYCKIFETLTKGLNHFEIKQDIEIIKGEINQ